MNASDMTDADLADAIEKICFFEPPYSLLKEAGQRLRAAREARDAVHTLKRIDQQWCIEGDYADDADNPGKDQRHPIERRLDAMQAELGLVRARLAACSVVARGGDVRGVRPECGSDSIDAVHELQEERAQVGRELAAALERVSDLDDQVAKLTQERDEARVASRQLGQQLMQVNQENASLRAQLQSTADQREYLFHKLQEAHGDVGRLRDALRALSQQAAAGRSAA